MGQYFVQKLILDGNAACQRGGAMNWDQRAHQRAYEPPKGIAEPSNAPSSHRPKRFQQIDPRVRILKG
jgi:hypothetical protein